MIFICDLYDKADLKLILCKIDDNDIFEYYNESI